MDSTTLMERVKLILTSPVTEWNVIEAEQTSVKEIYTEYILILAVITPIAGFIKTSIFGVSYPFLGTYRVGIGAGLGHMILSYLLSLVSIYLIALAIDRLAPTFGGSSDRIQALKTIAYALTAAWLAGILQIIPWIGFPLFLVGSLYSIYLLYLGLPTTMKCPREKSTGYTAATVVIAIVLGFLFSLVAGGLTGVGMRGAVPTARSGMQGNFDKNSLGGKLENWSKKLDNASKDMEKAQKSGDVDAQQKAMGNLMATALGNKGPIETLAPDRIKAFLPEKLAGRTRSDLSAERSGAMGFQISTAQASYRDDKGQVLSVEITDMGLAKGVMALAGWAGVEKESSTADGFEKTFRKGSQIVHEQWNSKSHSGEYTTIVGNRFSVKVSGEAAGIDTLKEAAEDLNLTGLEALKDEGIKK